MKISKIVTLFSILACLVLVLPNANAQSKKKKKSDKNDEYFDDSGDFKDKLWYGGGLGLGFGGSTFNFNISPMVGYKIYDRWSVGPRVPINYTYIKENVVHATNITDETYIPTGEVSRKGFSVTSIGVGVFTRFKVIEQFFLHGEYSINRTKLLSPVNGGYVWDDEKDKIHTVTESVSSASLGVGYSSGDVIGYEISVLYDFLLPDDSPNLPFDFRIGFNYNF